MDRLMRIFVLAFLFLSGGSVLAARPDSLAVSRGGELRDSVSATSHADTAGKGFDALEYSLQKRHIFRGRPFVAGRFTDNTFISIHGGTEQLAPMGNSTIAWGMALKLSYGKWIDAYNAFRLSLAVEDRFRNADKSHVWNVGLDIAHMFNLSSYFGGYNPSRFFEISTVEGLKYRYAIRNGKGAHAGGVHIGFNLKMNVARNLDFFVEPVITAYSDGTDYSAGWNWRIYDVGYGGTMGLSYRIHSHEPYRCGPESAGKSFVSASVGPQYQNSDLVYHNVGFGRSIGFHVNLSYGRWFSRVFALRVSGMYSQSKWITYTNGISKNTLYYGARVEGMLDVLALILGAEKGRLSLPVLFGPEAGCMTKQELSGNISRGYLGLTGGFQVKYRVAGRFSIFAEPHFSVVPYNIVTDTPDPLKNVGVNYYDNTFNFNVGLEVEI